MASSAVLAMLKACVKKKDLQKGERIHAYVLKDGLLDWNSCITDALINMYSKCGALAKAQDLLDGLPTRNIFCWTAVITEHARQGQALNALKCLEQMRHEGLCPDDVTFLSILKACGSIRAIDKGEQIHEEISNRGLLENNVMLGNALVDMYAKCGALDKARKVLDELNSRDVITWNALIAGYSQKGQAEHALNCFDEMKKEHITPDEVTFSCMLKACGSIGAIDLGKQIHDEISRQGLLKNNVILGNALVDMYAKCGLLVKAQRVLQELSIRDVVSWNALIAGYALQGYGNKALHCFKKMQQDGHSPNAVTFICTLKACVSIGAIDVGRQIHDEITLKGLLKKNVTLGNALVDMYSRCGAFAKAYEVLTELLLENVISWSALITGFAQHGYGEKALESFEQMQLRGLIPDAVTYVCVLKACGSLGEAAKGEKIHDEIVRQGLLGKHVVLGNALVNMYAQFGQLAKAHQLLEELPVRDVISWSILIAKYAQQGQGKNALTCLDKMRCEGLTPGAVTYTCILNACGGVGAFDKGERIHDELARQGLLRNNVVLCNALVDMYVKCGFLAKAQKLVEELHVKNVISQSTISCKMTTEWHRSGRRTLLQMPSPFHLCLVPAVTLASWRMA